MSRTSSRRWSCASPKPPPASRSPRPLRNPRPSRQYQDRLQSLGADRQPTPLLSLPGEGWDPLIGGLGVDQWVPACAGTTTNLLAERDGDDLVGFVAARGRDLDAVALALADQRARQGRGNRQPPVLDVGLVLADDPVGLLLVRFLVGQGHGRAEFDDRPRQLRDVDDLGAGDLVLELAKAAL